MASKHTESLIPIEPGQWALAFDQPFGPYDDKLLTEHLEQFSSRGGGWDHVRPAEIFLVHQVEKVSEKTYQARTAFRTLPGDHVVTRHYRVCVSGAGKTEAEMIALRDRFYVIGAAADDAIEAEADRRMEKFIIRERARAAKKIHRLFPAFFPAGDA